MLLHEISKIIHLLKYFASELILVNSTDKRTAGTMVIYVHGWPVRALCAISPVITIRNQISDISIQQTPLLKSRDPDNPDSIFKLRTFLIIRFFHSSLVSIRYNRSGPNNVFKKAELDVKKKLRSGFCLKSWLQTLYEELWKNQSNERWKSDMITLHKPGTFLYSNLMS